MFHRLITAFGKEKTSFSGQLLKETILPWNRTDIGKISATTSIPQIYQTYILVTTKEGLVLSTNMQRMSKYFLNNSSKPLKMKRKRKLPIPSPIP
jgi:hypothetical protein